jgi:hypothetical protein
MGLRRSTHLSRRDGIVPLRIPRQQSNFRGRITGGGMERINIDWEMTHERQYVLVSYCIDEMPGIKLPLFKVNTLHTSSFPFCAQHQTIVQKRPTHTTPKI